MILILLYLSARFVFHMELTTEIESVISFSPRTRHTTWLHEHINGADEGNQTPNLLFTKQWHYHCATPALVRVTGFEPALRFRPD